MGGSYTKPAEIKSKYYPSYVQNDLPRMEGKTVAITGCTSGTGLVCAKTLAGVGARIIMLNRSSARADEAVKAVKEAVPGSDVRHVPCDLMSFDSVRKAAQQLKSELSELDVLCNNAGIMATKDQATVDGCDTQMQTNHLSHYLLTAELWPLLEKAANGPKGEARVVNHSSMARSMGNLPLDSQYLQKNGGNLGGNEMGCTPFSGARWTRYQQTKLANLVFTYALRDRAAAANSKVKALCAHPGLSSTNLQVTSVDDGGMGTGFTSVFMSKASQSAEDGTVPLLRCCADPTAKSGDFFGPKGMTGQAVLMPPKPEEALCDEASRKMLWDVSAEVTGASFPF